MGTNNMLEKSKRKKRMLKASIYCNTILLKTKETPQKNTADNSNIYTTLKGRRLFINTLFSAKIGRNFSPSLRFPF